MLQRIWVLISLVALLAIPESTKAQYFGRNKPLYRKFSYDVYQTPNFEIYHYFKSDSLVNTLSQSAEKWYYMHQQVFGDTIKERNPIIFYGNHADFQQTTAIMGSIGVGTGGVTEALKNRVIMPVTETWAQTDHVLGHELVHAFQYNSLINGDSTSLNSVRNLPLWMVEGMAEYLSIGSTDAQTSMWMRDAILNNDFPTLEDMTRYQHKYFPYRYGHAFWAFLGRTFGDSLINPIFKETAKRGYDYALRKYIGIDEKTFSVLWKKAYVDHYKDMMKDTVDRPIGKKILFEDNAGHINISPAISPDGKYVAFYSEKDLFSIDLFLADAHTGKIIKKLSSVIHQNEVDALNFIESAGTWSPDSKQFAFVAFSKGKNQLLIVDVEKDKLVNEIIIPGLPSFNYPAWSPNGKTIVLSGLKEGVNDLYAYSLETGALEKVTNDPWCNVHPTWSGDGSKLVFVTDRPFSGTGMPDKGYYLAEVDIATKEITVHYNVFPNADNLNPVYSKDDKKILFLSNSDGFRNLFEYNIETGEVNRLTSILTGISGMTPLAPAMSIARNTGEISYSYYFKNNYAIYQSTEGEFERTPVEPSAVNFVASTLPPYNRAVKGIIDPHVNNMADVQTQPVDSFKRVRFKPRFQLDYISNIGVGVSSSPMGTGMAGGVEMLFSDITGGHLLHTGLSLNGEIYDFGGQVTYVNRKNRVMWATTLSHIPYSSGYYEFIDGAPVQTDQGLLDADTINMYHIRTFETQIGGMVSFPLSQTMRIEASSALAWYNYRVDVFSHIYYNGYYGGSKRRKADAPDGFNIIRSHLAYVIDNSNFGIASPMKGTRIRIQGEKIFGEVDYWGTLADFRHYIFVKPISFAFRGYYNGRHGNRKGLDRIYPLFLGYPWLIRGYERGALSDQITQDPTKVNINQLLGDQMGIVNFEIRIPFTGPERLSLIKSSYFYTELAIFADAGIAWDRDHAPSLKWKPDSFDDRIPMVSTGISLRVNLFGMLVLEPYYAIPFQLGGFQSGVFGLNFLPGW